MTWTLILKTTVYGSPVAQPRQRHKHVKTQDGNEFDMNYTPSDHPVQQFKYEIKQAIKTAMVESGHLTTTAGPVMLECRFYLPRPLRFMRKRDPEGPMAHTNKPDLDNLYKSVQDAMAGLLWRDDSQVVSYGPDHGKFYHEKAGQPRLELAVYIPGEQAV